MADKPIPPPAVPLPKEVESPFALRRKKTQGRQVSEMVGKAAKLYSQNAIIARNPFYTWRQALTEAGATPYQLAHEKSFYANRGVQSEIEQAKKQVLGSLPQGHLCDRETWLFMLLGYIERMRIESKYDLELDGIIEYGKATQAYNQPIVKEDKKDKGVSNTAATEEIKSLQSQIRLLKQLEEAGEAIADE